jgi:hypothetical protein
MSVNKYHESSRNFILPRHSNKLTKELKVLTSKKKGKGKDKILVPVPVNLDADKIFTSSEPFHYLASPHPFTQTNLNTYTYIAPMFAPRLLHTALNKCHRPKVIIHAASRRWSDTTKNAK